jgi:hypothetical protein
MMTGWAKGDEVQQDLRSQQARKLLGAFDVARRAVEPVEPGAIAAVIADILSSYVVSWRAETEADTAALREQRLLEVMALAGVLTKAKSERGADEVPGEHDAVH